MKIICLILLIISVNSFAYITCDFYHGIELNLNNKTETWSSTDYSDQGLFTTKEGFITVGFSKPFEYDYYEIRYWKGGKDSNPNIIQDFAKSKIFDGKIDFATYFKTVDISIHCYGNPLGFDFL